MYATGTDFIDGRPSETVLETLRSALDQATTASVALCRTDWSGALAGQEAEADLAVWVVTVGVHQDQALPRAELGTSAEHR